MQRKCSRDEKLLRAHTGAARTRVGGARGDCRGEQRQRLRRPALRRQHHTQVVERLREGGPHSQRRRVALHRLVDVVLRVVKGMRKQQGAGCFLVVSGWRFGIVRTLVLGGEVQGVSKELGSC